MKFVNSLDVVFFFLKQRSNGGRGPGRDRTTRIFQSDSRKVLSVQHNHEKKKKKRYTMGPVFYLIILIENISTVQ